MTKSVIHNMQGRIEQLREVAKMTRDPEVARIALTMANDIETDIQELESVRKARIEPRHEDRV